MTLEYAGQFIKKSLQSKVTEVEGIATGGGSAANCTITTGLKNVASVNYNSATGKYLITFRKVGTNFLGGHFTVLSATGASNTFVCRPVAYSATNKTLSIEVYDVATPTAHDLATSEQLWITLK